MIHPSMKTTEFLLTTLQQKEGLLKESGSLSLMANKKKDWASMTIEEKKKHSRCKICNEKGHWVRECPSAPQQAEKPAAEKKPQVTAVKETKANIMFNLGSIKLKDKWILDSGATEHMCNNKLWFSQLSSYTTPRTTAVGNGDSIGVYGVGQVELVSKVGSETQTITLTNVSYIPGLVTNLVSVGAASMGGISTVFRNKQCQMLKGEDVVVAGHLTEDDLYVLDLGAPIEKLALITRAIRTAQEWHEVFGHPNEKTAH